MRAQVAHEQAQSYLRQRNRLAVLASAAGLAAIIMSGFAMTKSREIVLVPVTAQQISVSTAGVTAPYLELVTRDTALMLLNRSPQSLDYWMDEILKVADPATHGRLKAELVKIVEEQRGSDISQTFIIRALTVDPASLISTATGTLKTFVGAQVIASEDRVFEFSWSQRGLSLALTGFRRLPQDKSNKD
ncbi:type IV conjugative transfer system protein TraE [Parasphingorhabdus sp. JC815]|uniref:type IV conjugative transfer system protein TraE n=1 Tax=Parasphingorhabdus sp. JC815 TaxID=3232140 RepID=UPI0034577491